MNYVFVGGTFRGFKVLNALISCQYIPQFVIILKEDDHELSKYSKDIIELSVKYNLPYRLTKKINSEDYKNIEQLSCDFAIVCGWRTLIDFGINKSFKFGMVAAHDSLLPAYRGFAPLNWGIINGEEFAGVTLFLINEGETDSGLVIDQKKIVIEYNDYAIDIFNKITSLTVDMYLSFFQKYKDNSLELTLQDESLATYTCKRTPDDGIINWNNTSSEIYNLIRGLAPPYPGAFCYYNNVRYKIHKASKGKNDHKMYIGNIPGRVISINSDGIEILCGKGSILISLWESENSNVVFSPNEIIKSISVSLN